MQDDWETIAYIETLERERDELTGKLCALQKIRQDENAEMEACAAEDEARAERAEALVRTLQEWRPITMQDVRLAVGEGKLTNAAVLVGCNVELRRRAIVSEVPTPIPGVEDGALARECREAAKRIEHLTVFSEPGVRWPACHAWTALTQAADHLEALASLGGGERHGWIAVPSEPTDEMLRAGFEAQHPKPGSQAYGFNTWATWEQACQLDGFREEKAVVYRAMIASRPIDEGGGTLFQTGQFALASGSTSTWKIECDALTAQDWQGLAAIAAGILPPFGSVVGVPRGGTPFALALRPYATVGPLLIAEDVVTTGGSMERFRVEISKLVSDVIGVAAFCRGDAPAWVTPVFRLGEQHGPQ